MRRLFATAAYRIAFTCASACAIAIVALGVIVYFAADADFRRQQDARIVDESGEVAHAYRGRDLAALRAAISRREAGTLAKTYGYALFDRNGRRIWGSMRTDLPALGMHDISFDDPREGADAARALTTDLSDRLRLVVALDPEELERFDGTILAVFAGAFGLVVLLGVAGALVLGGYLQHRLGRISGTARAIVAGDLERRVPVSARGDEFDQLALALNAMLDRIAHLLENLQRVSSDVAHDLRTPLARLRSRLEQALDGSADLAATRGAIEEAIAQSDHLLALFAAILRISEVEAGALRRTFAAVDLSELTRDLCESYSPAVTDGGRTLTCVLAPGLMVHGDRELLAQALINLLDNAQHHTPAGTTIAVNAATDGMNIGMTVADDGPGVAPEDRALIVRRFARLDASRGTPGHGLGLNLVAAIVTAHGGALTIGDNRPGLKVTMTLPSLAA